MPQMETFVVGGISFGVAGLALSFLNGVQLLHDFKRVGSTDLNRLQKTWV